MIWRSELDETGIYLIMAEARVETRVAHGASMLGWRRWEEEEMGERGQKVEEWGGNGSQ